MKTPILRLSILALSLLIAAPFAQAEDLGAVRARMEKRISTIDSLKTSGVLGENNRGFLEVRTGDDQGVAGAENADRAVVYEALAQKTGVTAESVGRARAKKIEASSASGVWVQADNGEWLKK